MRVTRELELLDWYADVLSSIGGSAKLVGPCREFSGLEPHRRLAMLRMGCRPWLFK